MMCAGGGSGGLPCERGPRRQASIRCHTHRASGMTQMELLPAGGAMSLVRLACVTVMISVAAAGCGQKDNATALKELQRVKSGDLDVVLLTPDDGLTHGKDSFVLEFRSQAGELRDVGTVKANATMPMAGMPPMFGSLELHAFDAPGRYLVDSDLGMSGTWQINVEWQGPAGSGTA